MSAGSHGLGGHLPRVSPPESGVLVRQRVVSWSAEREKGGGERDRARAIKMRDRSAAAGPLCARSLALILRAFIGSCLKALGFRLWDKRKI